MIVPVPTECVRHPGSHPVGASVGHHASQWNVTLPSSRTDNITSLPPTPVWQEEAKVQPIGSTEGVIRRMEMRLLGVLTVEEND